MNYFQPHQTYSNGNDQISVYWRSETHVIAEGGQTYRVREVGGSEAIRLSSASEYIYAGGAK